MLLDALSGCENQSTMPLAVILQSSIVEFIFIVRLWKPEHELTVIHQNNFVEVKTYMVILI